MTDSVTSIGRGYRFSGRGERGLHTAPGWIRLIRPSFTSIVAEMKPSVFDVVSFVSTDTCIYNKVYFAEDY